MWFRTLLACAVLSVGVASAAPTPARFQDAQYVQPNMVMPTQGRDRGGDIRPLREVVDDLRAQYGGELISARLEDGGRPFYFIRWRMPDGQVRDFRVPASR